MKDKLQTLNKGQIEVGYLDRSTKRVRIGDLIIPTDKFLRFAGELIRNKNSQIFLSTEGGEITGMFEYNGMVNPKKIILGDYEINGRDYGALIDGLIDEGASMERGEI